ncbi:MULTISPECIES: peptidoglycan DD-metalloendopeptidase family protein [Propionibacteriales]|uniref:peptidoglycan DD-metalloendopeptidase family protein n=1 Tax=Propionibacteriales TaxID=85009 RepID=UPI002B1FB348|nr:MULTISPECIES: peptidoglycan DD-metalloendopeptidase family protein [Propionibacteriales]MEA4945842.1 peptidoglycan DD-metalloendopeptidase family protein [Propionicimonas sp.]MEA5155659.1 peptidoglycan DD-metalloendopeptidase family protein [Raineyella sp.]
MGKLVAVVGGGLAAVVLTSPLLLALVVAAILVPAAQVQQTIACGGSLASTGEWRVPFVDTAYQVTSGYGYRYSPISGASELHDGTDLAAPQTTVVSVSSGRVSFAGWGDGFGYHVVIDHGAGITTLYGHLDSIDPAIAVGAPVAIGQPVGVEGSTGWSTGIHLHFTIKQDGAAVDPVPFMLEHGAPLNGQPAGPSSTSSPPGVLEGGVGFELPEPEMRQDSLHNPPLPIPAEVQRLYEAAAARYGVPWTLLAGVGMTETAHGRNTAVSSAGAQGLMQFMPATWAAYGVDGDNDGRADINNSADSVHSAANYLVASGALDGPDGVKRAVFAYNHADWYVGDVLFYANSYGGGQVLAGTSGCLSGNGTGDPTLPPLTSERLQTVLGWARGRLGLPYRMGANGPDAYDCSSFTQAAYAQIGVTMPRTAEEQRNWLAAGNGYRVPPGQERPGDLIFIDSYLGPNRIGHVALVWDPVAQQTIEAASSELGVIHGNYTGWANLTIFEIWRVGNVADTARSN